jgi:hypothetical protein
VVNYQSLAVAQLATGQFGVPDLSDDEYESRGVVGIA